MTRRDAKKPVHNTRSTVTAEMFVCGDFGSISRSRGGRQHTIRQRFHGVVASDCHSSLLSSPTAQTAVQLRDRTAPTPLHSEQKQRFVGSRLACVVPPFTQTVQCLILTDGNKPSCGGDGGRTRTNEAAGHRLTPAAARQSTSQLTH